MTGLDKARYLDVRASPEPAISDSVWIPLVELPDRSHELPSRRQVIHVAGLGPEAAVAVALLRGRGRLAEFASDFEMGESPRLRLWSPNAYLEECLAHIPAGRAFDIACGAGRDAVFAASCGFEVTAIDHLPDAISLGRDLEARYAPDVKIEWICADVREYRSVAKFDLVTCFFFLDRELLTGVCDLMSPGGHLVVETFTAEHRGRFGKPKSESLVLQPGELMTLATGLEIVAYDESWRGELHTARLHARRP